MAFQSTEDGARVILTWGRGITRQWTNHFWCSKVAFNTSDQQALADLINTAFGEVTLTALADTVVLDTIQVVDERTQGAPIAVTTATNGQGVDVAHAINPGHNVVVTARTALRGRAYRGRWYIGGMSEAHINFNTWGEDALTTAATIVETVHETMRNLGWVPGVRSGQLNNALRLQGVVTPITSIVVRNALVGTQRRRIPRS